MSVTWTALPTPFDNLTQGAAVIQVGARIIVGLSFGLGCSDFPGTANIYTSDDGGATWEARPSPFDVADDCLASVIGFAYSASLDRLVAVGVENTGTNSICYSDDHGDTWTGAGQPNNGSPACVARDDGQGLFVMGTVAGTRNIFTSPDGITWTSRTSPWNGGTADVRAVCYAAGTINLWVAVGHGATNKSAMTASDPTSTWTSVATGPFNSAGSFEGGFNVVFDGTVLVATANYDAAAHAVSTSPDASAWTGQTTDLDGHLANGLAASSSLILAGGPAGIVESDDHGVTWTAAAGPLVASSDSAGCIAISIGVDRSIAVGRDDSGEVTAATTVALPGPPIAAPVVDRPSWRWFITDLRSSRVLTSLTTIATEITTSRLLAASWPAALTVPSDDPRVRTTYVQFDGHPEWDEPFVAKDIRALIGFRNTGTDPLWECAYAGIIKQVVDRVVDGVPQTTINAWDARKYLEFLPLVDADGDLPGVNGITFTATDANTIARAALENWITNNPGCLAETLFDLSSGLDESCAPLTMTFGRGTTINDVWTQLEQTGAIDLVLDPPFDPRTRPGCIAVVNFEVQHGQQQHAAIFSWDRSPRSLPEISRMEDGLKDANTIQDYTDDVAPATPATDTDSATRIGEHWAMRTWVGQQDATAVASFAAEEILFRTNGQTTVTANPSAPRSLQPVQEYDIGDRVPVYASERLRKPIASTMRIYAIPFTIDESAHETVSELVVSADAVVA